MNWGSREVGKWGVGCGVWGVGRWGAGRWGAGRINKNNPPDWKEGVGCGVWGVGCRVWEEQIKIIS